MVWFYTGGAGIFVIVNHPKMNGMQTDINISKSAKTIKSDLTQSQEEFAEAKKVIAGGVNSPVRSWKGVDGEPVFIKSAAASKLYDVDDKEYIDFCLSWGVHILGHAHEAINKAVNIAVENGSSFGLPTPGETILAKAIAEAVPSIEQLRLVSSGTEAVMSATRLARAFTGKKKILKFDGGYHGHADHLLVSAGSGLATQGLASSAGVPSEFVQHTISLPFNDELAVFEAFSKYKDDIAAIIVEPVPANMGVILPQKGFLEFLRNITNQYQSLLIFDEVITGFRPSIGGAQSYFGVKPDLTTLGKIIGGGFPIGAYGGRRDIMSLVAPSGDVYQAGTLSGNPVAVAAGIATLKKLRLPQFYQPLNHKSRDFIFYLEEITSNKGIVVNSFKSMFTLFFSQGNVNNFADAKNTDTKRFAKFHKKTLEAGIFLSPSPFEANFISAAHTPADLNRTLEVIHQVLKTV
jgi:glutamate-1-semialdehyde 2,1-aminomutase